MYNTKDRYADIEAGYSPEVIAIAREVIGEDALAGIGYKQDYKLALRAVKATLRTVARNVRDSAGY
jgi:hypothetical protein